MEIQTEIEKDIAVRKALRKEIASQYVVTPETNEFEIYRLREKWHRQDEAILVLEKVLKMINEA